MIVRSSSRAFIAMRRYTVTEAYADGIYELRVISIAQKPRVVARFEGGTRVSLVFVETEETNT